jgi:hypothetical protein
MSKEKESNKIILPQRDEKIIVETRNKNESENENIFFVKNIIPSEGKSELLNVQNNHLVLTKKLRGEITDLEFNLR